MSTVSTQFLKVAGPPSPDAAGRRGFSLVEVLVATSILIVIVLVIAMVFQQSSGAYATGMTRTDSQVALRTILGSMSRDLTQAVDARDYPGVLGANEACQVQGNRIAFVALTGTPDKNPGNVTRVPQWIQYKEENGIVKRSWANLVYNSNLDTWSFLPEVETTVALNDGNMPLSRFEIVPENDKDGGLPLRVDIEARIKTSGGSAIVSGFSAGPDREWNTKDDIVVGGRQ